MNLASLLLGLLLLPGILFANGVRWEKVAHYDVARINQILTTEAKTFNADPPQYPEGKHGVTLYRVTYPSVIPEQNNRATVATGLVALPDGQTGTLPLLSYQHGTVFGKQDVPSYPENSYESRLMVALFASQGYIVIGPDYFGMGDSKENEGYTVLHSHQQACIDLLRNIGGLLEENKAAQGKLFLTGFSQGGYVTQAFLQRLELEGIPVEAAATAAGPSDPFALLNSFLQFPRENDAKWVSILYILTAFSYEEYYQIPGLAAGVIAPEQYEVARKIYLREGAIEKDLPTDLKTLLRKEYFDSVYFTHSAYGRLAASMQPYHWLVRTPLRMDYGGADEVVRPGQAKLMMNYQQAFGNDKVTAILTGEKLTHRGTYAHAAPQWKVWFDSRLKK